jgi:hypothetical protein
MALLAALLLATLARAAGADALPLSAIPLSSGAVPKVDATARIDGVRKVGDAYVTALDRPVCLSLFEPSVEDYDASGEVRYWAADPEPRELEILRLETDGAPVLDRTVIDHETPLDQATVLRHVRIPLTRIMDGPVSAYAYRTTTKLYVFVPRGFESPIDAFDMRLGNRHQCGFASSTLLVRGDVSRSTVQPPRSMKESERWLADFSDAFELSQKQFPKDRPPPPIFGLHVSVSRVSRDPEALVSVVVVAPTPTGLP